MVLAEPLTPEQEGRLPLAMRIVEHVVPEGAYGRMMKDTFDQMLETMIALMPNEPQPGELARALGVSSHTVEELEPAQFEQLSAIVSNCQQLLLHHMDGGLKSPCRIC